MVDDNLWFYAKDTRRALRITPLQRLQGSVSYGDLARLNWSRDYRVETIEEDTSDINDQTLSTLRLVLKAKSKGATYQSINLWVKQQDYTPLKAEVFLLSGKKFKTIFFTEYKEINGQIANTEIKFIDHFQRDKVSLMSFNDVLERRIPNRYFVKTGLRDVSRELQSKSGG